MQHSVTLRLQISKLIGWWVNYLLRQQLLTGPPTMDIMALISSILQNVYRPSLLLPTHRRLLPAISLYVQTSFPFPWHIQVRSVLTKFATSSNLVTVEFIVGWIKLECLARIQQMQTSTEGAACQESHSPALLSSCVLPSICHLLCCFTEGTFQTWESSCNEQDIKVESSASVSGWDFWCLPSVPRMKCALGVLNRDLYSLALEPLTDYYLLSPGSFLSTVLLSSILLAVVESPESAWEKFRSSLPPKDHNVSIWKKLSFHSQPVQLESLRHVIPGNTICSIGGRSIVKYSEHR